MADGSVVLEPLDGFDANDGQNDGQDGAQGGSQGQQEGGEAGAQGNQQNQAGDQGGADDGPYSTKTSKEFSNALKAWRDSSPEGAKFARMAKDDHARLFQLHQLEPEGIDGVKAKYALLDSIVHGEAKGLDAVTRMQEQIEAYGRVDQLIAAGDPTALDELGDDFNEGLAKLTPSILERVAAQNPEAYAAAVLPHFVEALKNSPLVSGYNALVDTLNEAPPTWLTADQKGQWMADRMQRVIQHASGMGQWLNAQAEAAKGKGAKVGLDGKPTQGKQQANPLDEREKAITQREQAEYWQKSIFPETDKIAVKTFTELFKPYEKRLKFDQERTQGLLNDFVKGVQDKMLAKKADGSPSDYSKQIQRYHGQKNPDAKAVTNFWSVEFNRHAKTVMQGLIDSRYKPFLDGKPNNPAASAKPNNPGSAQPGQSKQMQYVSVKPSPDSYDATKRSVKDIYDDVYRLRDGRVVKYKRA